MKLTLARARRAVREAARAAGLELEIVSAEWSGQLSRERAGTGRFRCARVIVELAGRRVPKFVTLETSGGWSVR